MLRAFRLTSLRAASTHLSRAAALGARVAQTRALHSARPLPTRLPGAARQLSTASKKVIEINDEDEYDKALAGEGLCVVYFTATWCGPCQMIKPIYEQMAEDFPDTAFLKVDVDDQAEIAAAANVRAMPTFHFMRGGKLLEDNAEIVGADPGKLLQYVQHHTK